MSIEQAQACIKKMKSDAEFRNRIMALDIIDDRLTAINEEGFICTKKDFEFSINGCDESYNKSNPCPSKWAQYLHCGHC